MEVAADADNKKKQLEDYDFKFLTYGQANNDKSDSEHHWFPVGRVLDLQEKDEVNEYLIKNKLSSNPNRAKAEFATKILFKLYSVIYTTPIRSYYLERSENLD